MGKSFEQSEYRGLMTLRRSGAIPKAFASHTLNSDHSSSTQISPMKGYSSFGNQANANDKITRQYTYIRGSGFATKLQVRDDATNSILELLVPGDTRNSANGEWLILVTNFTTAKIMDFAPFNDTGVDNLLMSNGTDNFSRWSGAVCRMDGAVLAGASSITVKKVPGDTKTNPTDGFPSSGTIVYKDTAGVRKALAYSSKSATAFTMTTPANTTASADNTGVADSVDTSTYSGVTKFKSILTAQGRLWGTGADSAPTTLYFSAVSDFTDFTAGTNPDSPGAADFPESGKNVGLGSIDDWIFIFKEKGVFGLNFQYPTSTTRVAIRKKVSDVGLACVKALALVGNDYWYVSPEGEIRQLSRVQSESVFTTIDLANLIRPTINGFDFSDCASEYWKKERIFVASCRSDSNQSANDKVIVIQFSIDIDGNAIINHGILDWFAGDWTVDDDLFYGGSAESKCFKAFDGYTKDGAGYDWEYITKLDNFGSEFVRKNIGGLWVKGRIGAGTTLNVTILYGENGSLATYEKTLSHDDSAYITEGISNPLGANALGSEPLGGTVDDIDELDPFLVYFALPINAKPFNASVFFSTSGAGQRVVVTGHAWDEVGGARLINYPKK